MVKPILLIGMMGCGKSTLGQMLAKRLGRAFIAVSYTHLTLPTT